MEGSIHRDPGHWTKVCYVTDVEHPSDIFRCLECSYKTPHRSSLNVPIAHTNASTANASDAARWEAHNASGSVTEVEKHRQNYGQMTVRRASTVASNPTSNKPPLSTYHIELGLLWGEDQRVTLESKNHSMLLHDKS